MGPKTSTIIEKLSTRRLYSDDGYLRTNYLVIFLLFGCKANTKELFKKRAANILLDTSLIVFLHGEDLTQDANDFRAAIDNVRSMGVEVRTLNKLHVCPYIMTETSNTECFLQVMKNINSYAESRDIELVLRPFLDIHSGSENTSLWLDEIKDLYFGNNAGSSLSKTCVMANEDEAGLILDKARLIDTAVFVALLLATDSGSVSLPKLIASGESDDIFYTANTVFISNPVSIRTLNSMHQMLERLLTGEGHETDLNLSFIQEMLAPIYSTLPIENDKVTFAPLYGVMPNPDRDAIEFMARLEEFAAKYYLSAFEFNRAELYKKFRTDFLREFIQSGKSLDYLHAIVGNKQEIEDMIGRGFSLKTEDFVPISPKGGMLEENMEVYADVEKRFSEKLTNMSKDLFEEYLGSPEFKTLPRLYSDSLKRIKNLSIELNESATSIRRSGEEIQIELSVDPDRGLVDHASKDVKAQSFFNNCIADITFGMEEGNNEAVNGAEERLLDFAFRSMSSLSAAESSREFMALLSRTCHHTHSDPAQKCITRIADRFRFPLRFDSKGQKCTFVWGSKENHLFGVWEISQDLFKTDTEYLKLETKERIVLLTVSQGFCRADIRGAK